ncbi:MAG: divalent-cation tolerance protein CutA [Candidatus Tectomicrobia bacterium]|uniref:Divalent-cation tolerance protein CutA n=1 Tax=Tectimicrobiota bacterium TaxID=2528274 RepID=A0A933GQ30_UNCTE|nr:divalent-cation tolerance protein CutA [Candidatus Tectomicrobia bacterium]
MNKAIVIFITTNTFQEAERIGEKLVDNHLAACVNVVPGMTSIYRWQGKICQEKEFLLIVKTMEDLFSKVKDLVLGLHSYELPEIISLPVTGGLERYLLWVEEECKGLEEK